MGATTTELETLARTLGAPYRVLKALGAGAAGEVFLVENTSLGRLEALKILKRAGSEAADAMASGRFSREIHMTQLLAHQNIVATYDFGTLSDGRRYLTMEYVEGRSLAELQKTRGLMSIPTVLGILAEVADALHHAHQAAIIHRDIKPHNLLVSDHPHGMIVRILDFGMAKLLGGDASGFKDPAVLTTAGAMFGTPVYMAPEQWRSRPPDPRTDLYALGCTAFELLVGEPPFRGGVATLMSKHLQETPRVPSTVDPSAKIPPELDAIVMTCLAKTVEQRFQSGAAVCAAIQQVPGYRPLRIPR